jgi:ABC-type sugar transport system ATPase subunit
MDLYHRPATEFVAGFIGSPAMNIVDIESDLARAVELRAGARRIGIRPEHIQIGDAGVAATIRVKEQLGGEAYLYTRTEHGADVVVKTDGEDQHAPGDRLHLALPPNRVHQFGADGASLGSTA